MIERLLKLVDAMVGKLETEMKKTDSKVGEPETAILMRLANSMTKLIELEAAGGQAESEAETREMQDIRDKLLQRIDELKRA